MLQAKITVSRPWQFVGVGARFRIEVDAVERAMLRVGQSVTVDVEPGHHEVVVRLRSHRCCIPGESLPGSHVRLIADVDDAPIDAYIASGLIRKMRLYRPFMQRARSRAGYLRIRVEGT